MPSYSQIKWMQAQNAANNIGDVGYNLTSYYTASPNYAEIMVTASFRATSFAYLMHNPVLDPTDVNLTIGRKDPTYQNLVIPKIYVDPHNNTVGMELDANGKPIDTTKKLSADIQKYSDAMKEISPYTAKDPNLADVKDLSLQWNTPDYKTAQKQMEKVLAEPLADIGSLEKLSNETLTTTEVDGKGAFEWMAKAQLNILCDARDKGLLAGSDMGAVLTQTLNQTLQIATSFVLERDKAYWANKLQVEQVKLAQMQNKMAQAELLMLPSKMELQYLQLENQRKQTEQAAYQTLLVKEQLKLAPIHQELQQVQLETAKKNIEVLVQQSNNNMYQSKADLQLKLEQLVSAKAQTTLIKAQANNAQAQLALLGEQLKASKAQYSDTLDGQEIGGILGGQIAVYKQQAASFEKDSFYKYASLIINGWTTNKTVNLAVRTPASFTAFGVDRMMNAFGYNYFNMPKDLFAVPHGYTDILSDAELDGKSAMNQNPNI